MLYFFYHLLSVFTRIFFTKKIFFMFNVKLQKKFFKSLVFEKKNLKILQLQFC